MTEYKRMEIIVGLFVFIGIAGMFYMALKLGEVGGLGADGYVVTADFDDAGGIRSGADVMMAGVVIGRVERVSLNKDDQARLALRIHHGVKLTADAIASIRTKGIIGDRYVRISQGGDDQYLADGDSIEETESAISIEDLIAKYVFSGKSGE